MLTSLAREFAVCDGWRPSMPGPTWPNRFFMMAASSGGLDHSLSVAQIAEWMTVDGFGFEHGSLFQALAGAHKPGGSITGTLIEPNYGDVASDTYRGGQSQHPLDDVRAGKTLIKQTYEALRGSRCGVPAC